MVKIKNRHRLKKRDIQRILDELTSVFSCPFFDESSSVETGVVDHWMIVLVDDEADFMMNDNKVFFTLKGLYKYQPEERFVVVDMGAVGFVANGADVMSPGVVDADSSIEVGDQVWVCDVNHRKPLAVGIALMDGSDMVESKSGKAIRNLHFVGDDLWSAIN